MAKDVKLIGGISSSFPDFLKSFQIDFDLMTVSLDPARVSLSNYTAPGHSPLVPCLHNGLAKLKRIGLEICEASCK